MKIFLASLSITLLFLFFLFFTFFPKKEAEIRICVSLAPLKCFTERIVQGKIPVMALLHAGQNHETYEVSPKEMLLLSQMKLYFSTDFPFERGLVERIKKMNREVIVVDLLKEIFPDQERKDPHIWTDPKLAKKIAKIMYEHLAAIAPKDKDLFQKGYEKLISDLDLLDREIEEKLLPYKGRKFYVLHPSWEYFAKDYGLEEVSIEREGKEPSLQELVSIIEEGKKDKVKVIFIPKGMSLKCVEIIAQALKAKIVIIDPVEEDYFSTLRKLTTQMQKGWDERATN
jgi:zinc transport system substrate-binding protein